IESHSLVIATGGTSVPKTGSTGDGYKFAKQLGHTITELFPTEVPITSPEPFIKDRRLKGLSLKNVALSVLKKNEKKRITHQMDIDFFPALSQAQVEAKIRKLLKHTPDKYVKNSLHGLIEERYLLYMLELANISEELTAHHISNEQFNKLVNLFKAFTFTVNG